MMKKVTFVLTLLSCTASVYGHTAHLEYLQTQSSMIDEIERTLNLKIASEMGLGLWNGFLTGLYPKEA